MACTGQAACTSHCIALPSACLGKPAGTLDCCMQVTAMHLACGITCHCLIPPNHMVVQFHHLFRQTWPCHDDTKLVYISTSSKLCICMYMVACIMDICEMPWCTKSMAGVDRHPIRVDEGSLPQSAAAGSPCLTGHF